MGYAGGSAPSPSYRRIGDHSECFQVDFDPFEIRYEDLLQLFWSSHNPTSVAHSRQYASLVLAHDEQQLAAARMSRDRIEAVLGRPVLTRIELLDEFYRAEDYHQKYYLRNNPELLRELRPRFIRDVDFVDSTAVARVNGYVAGAGTALQLEREVEGLGLSDSAGAYLRAGLR